MNYSAILALVALKLNRDDLSDDLIPAYINVALRKVEKAYNFRYMRSRQSAVEASSTGTIALPARYKETDFLFATVNGQKMGPLIKEDEEALEMHFLNASEGTPKVFASDATQIIIRPVPYEGTTFDWATYCYSLDLSPTNLTNWITDTAPDVLIYGACLEAMPDMVQDGRMGLWQKKYDDALREIIISSHKERFSGFQYVKPGTVV